MTELIVNPKSQKAYDNLMKQLERLGYISPIGNLPTHMHVWGKFGRKTVIFIDIDSKLVTYESTDYAEGQYILAINPHTDIEHEIACVVNETDDCTL